jgi:Cu(I)/Ag(I) efflux system periplasmic protein CusF
MKSLKKFILAALLGLSYVSLAPLVQAQQAAPARDAMSEGEIKKVDKAAAKLTIKHGELKNLGMPGMTMVFRVKDPAMLDKVKQGDKVRFVAEQAGGVLSVSVIEVIK